MGLVYEANKGLVKSWPAEANAQYTEAVINPGQVKAPVAMDAFSEAESHRLLLKLDAMTNQYNNPLITTIVAENAQAVFVATRIAKMQNHGEFGGILASGIMMDMRWLRPKDVGGLILNPPGGVALTSLYATGAGGTVYTWLQAVVANTAQNLIPAQTMEQFASVIHLGCIETEITPKITDVTFTLGGVATPAQSVGQNIKREIGGAANDIQVTRFEKPIIVGPLQQQQISVMPGITGMTRFQLLSLIIARAQELVA
jgi:hypothetical protein